MAGRLKKSKKKLARVSKKGRIKRMGTMAIFPNAVRREGDYYVAESLDVEIASFGKTRLAALKNLQEALEDYALGKATKAGEAGKLISLEKAKKILRSK